MVFAAHAADEICLLAAAREIDRGRPKGGEKKIYPKILNLDSPGLYLQNPKPNTTSEVSFVNGSQVGQVGPVDSGGRV